MNQTPAPKRSASRGMGRRAKMCIVQARQGARCIVEDIYFLPRIWSSAILHSLSPMTQCFESSEPPRSPSPLEDPQGSVTTYCKFIATSIIHTVHVFFLLDIHHHDPFRLASIDERLLADCDVARFSLRHIYLLLQGGIGNS